MSNQDSRHEYFQSIINETLIDYRFFYELLNSQHAPKCINGQPRQVKALETIEQ
jgi:hypothetical protein